MAAHHAALDRSRPAVVFERVNLAFDDHVVLNDLSFDIPTGAMRILLGPSGSGKSVILKMILGLLKPDSGTITVNGQRVDTMPEHELLKMRGLLLHHFRRCRGFFDERCVLLRR